MRRVALFGLLGCLLAVASGCASISYKPSLSLGLSPYTVGAKVLINQFKDVSPPEEKGKKFAGVSATEPGTLAGDLATEVTNAVLIDFSNNQVFESIQKRLENPSLILNGTIHRFYGQAGPNALMWATIPIDIVWFFGLPIQSSYGAVDLEISIQQPNGTLVGTYRGKSEFSDNFSIYVNVALAIGTRLNKAFDDAIAQIRNQILADGSKLTPQTSRTDSRMNIAEGKPGSASY